MSCKVVRGKLGILAREAGLGLGMSSSGLTVPALWPPRDMQGWGFGTLVEVLQVKFSHTWASWSRDSNSS